MGSLLETVKAFATLCGGIKSVPRAVIDGKESSPLDRDEDDQSMSNAVFLMFDKAEEPTPVIRVELDNFRALAPTCIASGTVELLRVVMARLTLP